MNSEALRIINTSLQNTRNANIGNGSVFIPCPFHVGDTAPSLGVNIDDSIGVPLGFFNCFGCGAKGPWNKLAEKVGYPTIKQKFFKKDQVGSIDFEQIKHNLFTIKQTSIETYTNLLNIGFHLEWPKQETWRSIPGNILHDLGARIAYDRINNDRAILLPVSINGNYRGVILGTNHKQKKSYIMNPGTWSKKYGLFPFDYITKSLDSTQVLTLVEGSRDALRLIKLGIPALAILGSQSWSENKINLILSLNLQGIVLAFDGDRAGVACTNNVYESLKGLTKVKVLKLMEHSQRLGKKVDPGNMDKKLVNLLKEKIRSIY